MIGAPVAGASRLGERRSRRGGGGAMLTRRAFVRGVGAAVGAAAVTPWLADLGRAPTARAQTLGYDPEQRYSVQTFDVEYRRDGDKVYLATVYQPRGAGPFPAMLDIHGGQWRSGD